MKKIVTFLLGIVVSAATMNAQFYDGTCGENLTWSYNPDNYTLTIEGSGKMHDSGMGSYTFGWNQYRDSINHIILPDGLTSIAFEAFCYCNITSIEIPNSVTSIAGSAFSCCENLKTITLPNNLDTIKYDTFNWCRSLETITIPSNVKVIEFCAFDGCLNLILTVPSSVLKIYERAFLRVPNVVYSGTLPTDTWEARSINGYVEGNVVYSDASKKVLLACLAATEGSVTIPTSVTSIGDYAFYACGLLNTISIPNSVETIGMRTFEGCSSLTSVTIPNSVSAIGEDAFSNVANIAYNGSASGAPWGARCVNGTVEGWLVFSDAQKTNLVVCTERATGDIIIPNSVVTIADGAFCECHDITSVEIPKGVVKIGEEAFYACKKLTSLNIPNTVTSIGNYAFAKCSGLQSISCHAVEPPSVYEETFRDVEIYIPLNVPTESVTKYQSAIGWRDFYHINGVNFNEAIEQTIEKHNSLQKLIVNGQILIRHGDKTYTINGQEIE